jgi:putative two-component system hydrogenase maturation factor HypX/HoxX
MGGPDFWSNGIHLNVIESAADPAVESWRNINAMNDLVHDLITMEDRLVVAALEGNAGAGGVMLALAADHVWARSGVVLNPHYKGMGGLYGSEYWTYLLPRRVGEQQATTLTEGLLPLGAAEAHRLGLIDDAFGATPAAFQEQVATLAGDLAHGRHYATLVRRKQAVRQRDEQRTPLAAYRRAELAQMERNFFGPDPAYHHARYRFVHKLPSDAPVPPTPHRTPGDALIPRVRLVGVNQLRVGTTMVEGR